MWLLRTQMSPVPCKRELPNSRSFPWWLFFAWPCGISPAHHQARLQPEPSKVPCTFMGQLLCVDLQLRPPSACHTSVSVFPTQQDSCTLLGLLLSVPWCRRFFRQKAQVIVGFTSFVSLFSRKYSPGSVSVDWKRKFHRFCPVLSLFMAQGLVWNQFTSHTLLLMRVFFWGGLLCS